MTGSKTLPALHGEQVISRAVTATLARLGEGFGNPAVRRAYQVVMGLLLFLFPFGVVFNLTGVLVDEYPWTSSVYILLIALATLLSEMRLRPAGRVTAEFAILALLLWAVEWVGVTTGVPFGEYRYTNVLGILVAGVPLAIPCAWYATVMNGRRIAEHLVPPGRRGSFAIPFAAGVLTLALDVVLEPMAAMVKGYWIWSGGTVPLQNYLSWVVFTVISVHLLRRADRAPRSGESGLVLTAIVLFGLQWVLFVITGAGSGHLIPTLISTALLGMLLLVWRRKP
jgi:bisanhydrobacterioruberin hydratase